MGINGGKFLGMVILVALITYGWAQTPSMIDPMDIVFFQGLVWKSWNSDSWYNVLKGLQRRSHMPTLQTFGSLCPLSPRPTVNKFYDHFQDTNFKDNIKELIEIRKRNKIRVNSTCTILTAERNLYMANIDGRVIMKIGSKLDLG